MKMKKLIATLAFIASAMMSYAQTITNTGSGIAGNGVTATTNAYNISMVTQDHFDGDRHPQVWITINGKMWPEYPPTAGAYCRVMNWDAVQGKWVQHGHIAATAATADGNSAFLGGCIFINAKTWRVISFKAIPYYTPSVMPSGTPVTRNLITVYVWSNITGTFVPRPNLNIGTIHDPAFMSGAVWLNDKYQIVSAIFDGKPVDMGTMILYPVPYVPAPQGGATNLPIMPAKVK